MSAPRDPPCPAPGLPPVQLRAARRALLAHYDRFRRDLPWRGEQDPYRVWVSEVMLQQTRVETVIPYYRRWLERFTDVEALARAGLDEVLLTWQGLGYYHRARALHSGARAVRDRYDGVLPSAREALKRLPGVGDYTAGAVASIAFGHVVGAVDGNVKRVLSRLHDEAKLPARRLRALADAWVDPGRPGDWNQALMELGATLCAPRAPACGGCPLATWCRSRAAGTQQERPAPAKGRPVPRRTLVSAVVVDGKGRGLLVRRPDGGLLPGLWAFPDVEVEEGAPLAGVRRAARRAARAAGAEPTRARGVVLAPVAHRFTHLAAEYRPVVLAGSASRGQNHRWVPLEGPWPVAVPVAQQKIARAAAAALRGAHANRGASDADQGRDVDADRGVPES
ncbi:MAG: A/G-specific adenine glycosylase [Gemmatimonadetes bacterium]|nr:A/G-specific adenine glycosylase [Gemmatimonadota bacterium]